MNDDHDDHDDHDDPPTNVTLEVGRRLRALRKAKGMSSTMSSGLPPDAGALRPSGRTNVGSGR
jgi:hypothetical protein